MEAFIIVANISKLNGLDIKNSPGPFKIGLRRQTSIELQEID